MDDKLLEEQLRRIRAMNERLSKLQQGLAETNQELVRNRDSRWTGPLHEYRDYRTLESPLSTGFRASGRQASSARSSAAESSRRRRRR
jgi:hypothetical protein